VSNATNVKVTSFSYLASSILWNAQCTGSWTQSDTFGKVIEVRDKHLVTGSIYNHTATLAQLELDAKLFMAVRKKSATN